MPFGLHHPSARLLLALVASLLCPTAASALTISGTTVRTLPESTPLAADQRATDIIYYLDLHAGPADERFSVTLTPGQFATQGRRDEGQSVDGPLQFGLYGPGEVGQVTTEPQFSSVCSDRGERYHGYATGPATADVWLPANANTTLAIRYKTGRRAPWADTDLRLRFAFQQQLVGTYDSSSSLFGDATSVADAGTLSITGAVPVVSSGKGRKIGAHLLLATTPSGTWGDSSAPRTLKRSATVRASGSLLPALAGKRVQLQWAKPGGQLRVAATVKTRSGGRFSATLHPPGTGTYELWATYPSQTGPLTSDTTSCPLVFKIR
ncbi:MAG: hypothetical protein QM679_12750 [Patulibacter sp.]